MRIRYQGARSLDLIFCFSKFTTRTCELVCRVALNMVPTLQELNISAGLSEQCNFVKVKKLLIVIGSGIYLFLCSRIITDEEKSLEFS